MTGQPMTLGIKNKLDLFQLPSGNYLSPSWMMGISVLQIITILIFVILFFITRDLHQVSTCVLLIREMGYAQYNFISLGVLMAGTMYHSILCIESLYQRRASCLYVMLGFRDGIYSYQHPAIIKQASSCHVDTSIISEPLTAYSLLGITSASFLLQLCLAIYLRRAFHQSLNPVHGALENLLKLDFFLVFAYGTQLSPFPLMTNGDPIMTTVELVLFFGISCLLFLVAWSMVLVTWQPLPWWRIMLNMMGLGVLCLGSIVYLCYRLVQFMLDPRTLIIRPALIFTSLVLIVALLLTMSIVTTCATQQWQARHLLQSTEKKEMTTEHNELHEDEDSAFMFMTPQTSRSI
ncbi:hypothetical protein BC941DRAFT_471225 [Chlamydoabsidia padenii]|nr:hypothetical protein BC941DRAFT_471225 [Chlamydoabsidia padenii]